MSSLTRKIILFFLIIFAVFACGKKNAKWSYLGKNGPQFWGDNNDYKFCKIGYNQSLININLPFNNQDLNFLYQEIEIDKKIWFVFKNPILLNQNQINSIIKNTIFVSNNARPLQKFEPQNF